MSRLVQRGERQRKEDRDKTRRFDSSVSKIAQHYSAHHNIIECEVGLIIVHCQPIVTTLG